MAESGSDDRGFDAVSPRILENMITKATKNIVIIGCYYGKFPDWMPYWLRSCADNVSIDYLLVTDIQIDDLPPNVRKIHLSLQELAQLCTEKLGVPVVLQRPYKLCDFKPMYGAIFEDYIQEYDYWGHCDFDLIWGDIRGFVERYEIEKYDKFLPLGHLSLYRNTTECNRYYRMEGSKCGDYLSVIKSDSNHAFDEVSGIYAIYEQNNFPMYIDRIFAEIKTYHRRFRLKACDKNYKHQVFYYEKGKVFRAYEKDGKIETEEFIYIHFRRKLSANKNVRWNELDSFYIGPEGFFRKKAEEGTTLEEIERYNQNPGFVYELFELVRFCVMNFNNLQSKLRFELLAMKGRKGK